MKIACISNWTIVTNYPEYPSNMAHKNSKYKTWSYWRWL